MVIQTSGVHHIGLNVTNLEKSKQFYQDLFGWKELGSDSKLGYAFFSDGKNMFTLWQQGTTPYSKGWSAECAASARRTPRPLPRSSGGR